MPCAVSNAHRIHLWQLHLLDGQRESGKNVLDREDSISKGIKMVKFILEKSIQRDSQIVALGARMVQH